MSTILILRGLPASGKSTYAAEFVRRDPQRWVRINRDDLRGMVVGPGNNPHEGHHEKLVRDFKTDLLRRALEHGKDVILDDTHLIQNTVSQIHKFAEGVGDVQVLEQHFDLPLNECIARDANRIGCARVGEDVIRRMHKHAGLNVRPNTYYPPRPSSGVSAPSTLPGAIICDLDGTLAINHGRSFYDASTCDLDHFSVPVLHCVRSMRDRGFDPIFVSGREEKYRPQTFRFLKREWLDQYPLYMRATGDTRKDAIVKNELYRQHIAGKYNVLFVLDDRNRVVDEWRRMGLTCFQVNNGAF